MKNTNNTLAAVQLKHVQLQEVIEQLKEGYSALMQAYCEYSAENGYNSVYNNDEHTINEDMLASIEDNITDDSEILKKLTDYVDKSVFAQDALMLNKYNECNDFIIYEYMRMIGKYSYKELNDVINHLNINFQ